MRRSWSHGRGARQQPLEPCGRRQGRRGHGLLGRDRGGRGHGVRDRSITKTFTAALFADALERGEVTESTRLGEVWPQLGGAVAEVRLADLAMQRSGLPRQQPPPSLGDGIAPFLPAMCTRIRIGVMSTISSAPR